MPLNDGETLLKENDMAKKFTKDKETEEKASKSEEAKDNKETPPKKSMKEKMYDKKGK